MAASARQRTGQGPIGVLIANVMSTLIRRATVADAVSLSRLAATTFRETFERENTPEDMELYTAEAFAVSRVTGDIGDPASIVLVAESDEGIENMVGYVHLVSGPAPRSVQGPKPMELKRLYVVRNWHGRGVAQALMEAALQVAREGGAETMWLGVWEHNARAAAFYRKYGFTRVGEHTFTLGRDAQRDWLLARALK